MKYKHVLLSGVAGHIGSHLAKRLLDAGHSVTGIDNLSLGKTKFIEPLANNGAFKFIQIDINQLFIYSHLLEKMEFDTIFHLAANSDISKGDPATEYNDTFSTTIKLLEYARICGIKEFLFTSSGSVYGDTSKYTQGVINETYAPLIPISHYASAKLASEAFISSYSHDFNIRSFICRLPNVIGSHCTHGVIPDFINKIKANPAELEVLGDGTQIKPYMHVQELIDAMLFIWENANEQVNIYNIAGIDRTPVSEIARKVIKYMGTDTKIRYTSGDRGWKGDSPKYHPCVYKLNKLGYICKTTSNDAVSMAIQEILDEIQ